MTIVLAPPPSWRLRLQKPCSAEGCESPANTRGMCRKHYFRWWRGGGETGSSSFRWLTLEDRFWAKVDKTAYCWVWNAATTHGYGLILANGRQRQAHIVAYELLIGPVPVGLDLDHLCRNRACVRPDHLEPVTRRVNLLRGKTIPASHAAKTHCPQGHPYSGENLRITKGKNGDMRICKQCDRERHQAVRGRKRSESQNIDQSTLLPDDES